MKTFIRELKKIGLRRPILLEGFPGLGYIGKITINYIIQQLKAKKFAELYSPFFPHHVLTNPHGSVRLPRAEFYFWKNPLEEKDVILLTTDTQAQTVEGHYEVVNNFLDFAKKIGIETIIAVGGFSSRVQNGDSRVICVSTNKKLLDRGLKAGAEISPTGNPIVGFAGLTIGLSKFRGIDAMCILGETAGHVPDPAASKNVLKVIQRFLDIDLDFKPLDKAIEKVIETLKKMEDIQDQMDDAVKKSLESELRKTTYII